MGEREVEGKGRMEEGQIDMMKERWRRTDKEKGRLEKRNKGSISGECSNYS